MTTLARIERLVDVARLRGALMGEVAGAADTFTTPLHYPKLFREFLDRHTFFAFNLGGVRVYSNVRGEEDGLENLLADKILTRELVNAGFLPFGRPATGSYDRICFVIRGAQDPDDAPVVLMDHEAILSNKRIPKPEWIADGLMELVDCESRTPEPDAPPNSRPPSSFPPSRDVQTPDPLRAPSSGGCG
jgi:hypothetical protein